MDSLPRSPALMSRGDTGLLVVDVQDKLVGLISSHARIIWNIRRLLDAATLLKLPLLVTEQYPERLGGTVAELAARLPAPQPKREFSCLSCGELAAQLERLGIGKWLVCGIETHVCVQQTTLDLISAGYTTYLAVDAVGSRHEIDHRTALGRMDSAGTTLTTTEAAMFEWCATSAAAEFKALSELVKESPPAE